MASKRRTAESTIRSGSPEIVHVLTDRQDNAVAEQRLFSQFLDRREVLAKFLTPKEGKERLKATAEKTIRFNGSGTFAYLNPSSSFIAPQIRERYNPDRIQAMGKEIMNSEDGQLQNAAVAFLDPDHIDSYLADLNDFYGTDFSRDHVPYHEKFEAYVITAFGHNRQLAIASANQDSSGHPDKGILLFAKVFQNPTFWRVLKNQATENTGVSPEPWERSRMIVKYTEYRKRDGFPPTKEEIARLFSVDTDQVRTAERYEALPQSIKDLVMDSKLPYSGAFELDRLFTCYETEYVEMLASRLASRKASTPQIIAEVKKRLHASKLPPQTHHLIDRGVITLPQAEELSKLVEYGFSEETVIDLAYWIATNHPDIKEIRDRVSLIISNWQSGFVSMFGDDHLGDDEQTRELSSKLRTEEQRSRLSGLIHETHRRLMGALAAMESGIAGDVVERKPLANSIDSFFLDTLSKLLSEGNPNGDSLEVILARLHPNEFDGQLTELVELLGEVLDLELIEDARTQARRREEATRNIQRIVVAAHDQSKQEALF